MKIGIVGAGRLGCSLALGLYKKGFDISGIYSRDIDKQQYLASMLGRGFKNSLCHTVENSGIIFITVADAGIECMASRIAAEVEAHNIKDKTFFHCSGAHDSGLLDPIAGKGGYTGSLHPIQTFADREYGYKSLDKISFGFEGSKEAQNIAEKITAAFNSKILAIDKENKSLYHAAACIVSNYTVTLCGLAGWLFENIGIDGHEGIKAYMPLLERTVQNIGLMDVTKALTGPISRGDYGVIRAHVDSMKKLEPEIINAYTSLGRATVDIALKSGRISEDQARNILGILDDGQIR